MTYFLLILAGALGCNGIPHTVAALQGKLFPTPFAKPPGVGNSPPFINFAWGSVNLLLGLIIGAGRMPRAAPVAGTLPVAIGFIVTGGYLSWHFGNVRSAAKAGHRRSVENQDTIAGLADKGAT